MAGQFTWSVDIPSGVMRNHALSKKIRSAAVADAKFVQFARTEPQFGRKMGDTITVPRTRNIADVSSAVLPSRTKIPVDTFAVSKVSATVEQLARGIEYEDLALQLNNFDLEQPIQKALKNQMKLHLDRKAATALKACQIYFTPTSSTGGSWATSGSAGTSALANLSIDHLAEIRDYLTSVYHCPPYDGDDYIGCISTLGLRGLKQDPNFVLWRQYLQAGETLYKSEVGKVEQVRCLEINHVADGSVSTSLGALKGSVAGKGVGTNNVCGEGIIFGDDPLVLAEVITPELRAAIPGNFGLDKALAWYGVLVFVSPWNDTTSDGEVNVVNISST